MKKIIKQNKLLLGIAAAVLVLAIGYFYYMYSSAEGDFQYGSCSAQTVGQCCGLKGTCVAITSNNSTSYTCDRSEPCSGTE